MREDFLFIQFNNFSHLFAMKLGHFCVLRAHKIPGISFRSILSQKIFHYDGSINPLLFILFRVCGRVKSQNQVDSHPVTRGSIKRSLSLFSTRQIKFNYRTLSLFFTL
jgi:hypothetical protein